MQPFEGELSRRGNLPAAGRIVVAKPGQHFVQTRHRAQLASRSDAATRSPVSTSPPWAKTVGEAGEVKTGQPVAERRRDCEP